MNVPILSLAAWRLGVSYFRISACASRSVRAHSSQQTSTVRPPTLTLMASPSILQSQAAQVVSLMVDAPGAGHSAWKK
jgi:hypothetical protein